MKGHEASEGGGSSGHGGVIAEQVTARLLARVPLCDECAQHLQARIRGGGGRSKEDGGEGKRRLEEGEEDKCVMCDVWCVMCGVCVCVCVSECVCVCV